MISKNQEHNLQYFSQMDTFSNLNPQQYDEIKVSLDEIESQLNNFENQQKLKGKARQLNLVRLEESGNMSSSKNLGTTRNHTERDDKVVLFKNWYR